ncbi:MAG: metal-dependent phosphohydrolase, partial [Thermodesulfobacteriota bacterium]|nr:metal-dependent phosphohydrolase [Thermodesulfobacteriota bacterium]
MKIQGKNDKFDEIYRQQQKLTEICVALSCEKNIFRLLEMIVDESRTLTNAEAGTLYSVDDDKLKFEILQNTPLDIRFRQGDSHESPLEDISLHKNNRPNYSHVSSFAALTGEIINIEDVYNSKKFDFSGARKYDK